MKKNKIISDLIERLSFEYSEAKCYLIFRNSFELLISTVLAAQCTDERVNKVMVPLYISKYKSYGDILDSGFEEFRDDIKSINFFNNKAKAVIGICLDLKNKFYGSVPGSMEELTSLKGVGRKSANVVLGNCFGRRDVIIVDTHFIRVTKRLGISKQIKPEKIEMETKNLIPESEQFHFSMRIGEHGRMICKAKKPLCESCILNDICKEYKTYNK